MREGEVVAEKQKQTPREKKLSDLDPDVLGEIAGYLPTGTIAKLALTNSQLRGATAYSLAKAKQKEVDKMIVKFGGVNEAFLHYVKLQGEEGRYAFDNEINLLLENGADMEYIKDEAKKVIIKYGLDYGDMKREWPTREGKKVSYSGLTPEQKREMAETALGDQIARAGGRGGVAADTTELKSVALLLYSGVDVNGKRISVIDYDRRPPKREPFLNIIIKKIYEGRRDLFLHEKMYNRRNGEEEIWRTPEQDKIVKLLLEYGADPNGGEERDRVLPAEIKKYALAAKGGDAEKKYLATIKLLLEYGADPNSYMKYDNHHYPIFTGVYHNKPEIVKTSFGIWCGS